MRSVSCTGPTQGLQQGSHTAHDGRYSQPTMTDTHSPPPPRPPTHAHLIQAQGVDLTHQQLPRLPRYTAVVPSPSRTPRTPPCRGINWGAPRACHHKGLQAVEGQGGQHDRHGRGHVRHAARGRGQRLRTAHSTRPTHSTAQVMVPLGDNTGDGASGQGLQKQELSYFFMHSHVSPSSLHLRGRGRGHRPHSQRTGSTNRWGSRTQRTAVVLQGGGWSRSSAEHCAFIPPSPVSPAHTRPHNYLPYSPGHLSCPTALTTCPAHPNHMTTRAPLDPLTPHPRPPPAAPCMRPLP